MRRRVGGIRRLALAAVLAAALAALTTACGGEPPNVVLITVDDLGWRDVGCFGNPLNDTPNIDALCATGVRFTNAYAASAVCSPTRAAILTGRSPARTGVTDWIRPAGLGPRGTQPGPDGKTPFVSTPDHALKTPAERESLAAAEVTIAEMLRESGYATAHIGKWHLGERETGPEAQGFEINRGGSVEGHPPSYFDPYVRPGRPGIPGLPARAAGEYLTVREADEAVRFIRANRDRPFFLNLWHHAVHTPLQAPADRIAKYRARYLARGIKHPNAPIYAAMIESVDDAVGAVLSVLDELELSRNTLVIFTSDNGGWLGATRNAPLRGGKGQPYEGGLRVPLVVRWPARVAPGVSDQPVTSVDLLPTIRDAVGASMPPDLRLDGLSLLPILEEPDAALPRADLFWHYPHYWSGERPYSIVRRGDLKLIRRYDGRRFELYDLASDPGEKNELSLRMPESVRELSAALDTWLRETGALLPWNPDAPAH